ncbi:hypothetical protein KXR72_09270 [Stutzerimonas chloritidismutans]
MQRRAQFFSTFTGTAAPTCSTSPSPAPTACSKPHSAAPGRSAIPGIIDQTGTGNRAFLIPGTYNIGTGTDTAVISQSGAFNTATVTQR